MGIAERREREREEIRKKILDAARELFTREGYERVTMRAIADAIEYSPTAIYHHFADKDALVTALCHQDFSRLLEAFGAQPPAPDPVENIRRLGHAYARFGLENPNHYRFMFMMPAKVVLAISSPGHTSFAFLEQAVGAAIAAGRFRALDAHLAAQVLWAQIHGAVSLLITLDEAHWPGGPAAPDALVSEVIETGIRGLLAAPSGRA
jgi:AcrR family transcriptional regulator